MKVLIVPSWYAHRPNEQIGAFFREQAKAIKNAGVDVVVADATLQARNSIFSINNFRLQHFDDEGLDTYTYTIPSLGLWGRPELCEKIFYRNLDRIYRKIIRAGNSIDVIHAHSFYPAGYAAVRLGKRYGIPVVITEHSSGIISNTLDEAQEKLLNACVEGSDAFICVGNGLKKAVIEHTGSGREISVIPNMVDDRFVPNITDARNKDFCYVSIGNLIHRKRFDLTIKAFAHCFKGQEHIKLKIIGDGELSCELRKLTKELGIASQVVFTGKLSRNDVVRKLQSSNVFVLPSDFETFGVVYIEAMACGVPVIGTKNGGADDIISADDGILVDVNDVKQLSKAMLRLYDKYDEYDGKLIADRCRNKYGEFEVAQKIIDVYVNVVGK